MIKNLDRHPITTPAHEIRVLGAPLEPRQLEALRWAVLLPFDYGFQDDKDEEALATVLEMSFDLPYDQGPGYTLIQFGAYDELYPGGMKPPIDSPEGDDWTELPIVVTFGYSDSMTSIWTTPIYYNPNWPAKFALGDY